jgi:hypothetical protein
MLKIDGVGYTQSINKFASKLANFPELTDKEELINHMVTATCVETFENIAVKAFGNMFASTASKLMLQCS